ncbi:MAG: sigma 54-interacting transcriptional regulator [Pseudomonadota bacterium]
MPRNTSRDNTDEILRLTMEGTSAVVGEAFFRSLVRHLAEALQVRYAFISEFTQLKSRVRILAFWPDDKAPDGFEYDLEHTPCEQVLGGEMRFYPSGVQQLFPEEVGLVELGVESYLAIPLTNAAGEVLGHLAMMNDRAMENHPRDMSVFKIFGARAAAELERKWTDDALQASEQRLAAILDSAMDAIITMDETRRITLFNNAAERVFGCAAAWALGQPFDRFLSKPFRRMLDEYFTSPKDQVWAPEGLTALRANGEEFQIEATLSPVQVRGERLYTVILRDINDRRRAEEELNRLKLERHYLREQAFGRDDFQNILGRCPAMQKVFADIREVAPTNATVLLNGETGTGKELIARAIHDLSPRHDKILVKMNCAALPSELIESELLGHEKGAFTGATAQRKGRFELADGGTLFLDEVGELSLPAQAKLLRVLEEHEFERVGGARTIRVDVRVIAATNRNLEDMVREGSFRADLYYRLHIFPVRVPPLRERKADIPLLTEHFLAGFGRQLAKPLGEMSRRSMERLMMYDWPGNVRELRNVLERAAILAKGPIIDVDDLIVANHLPQPHEFTATTLAEVERAHIKQVLERAHWVIEGNQGAAVMLGMNPSTLRFRIQKLGIKRPQSEPAA